MKVSLNLYGEQAKALVKELGLQTLSSKTADVPMTAHFVYRDVEGHTVISAEFTSMDAVKVVVVKSLEQKMKENLEQDAEAAQLRAELASMTDGY